MTCIVGVLDGANVYIGGDSAGVSELDLRVRADRKVFQVGPYAFGFTSSFRMGQLLRYALTPPTPAEDVDLERFMATDFVNSVRNTLKAGGYATKDKEVESGGTFLVGVRGRLFTVFSDYQVGEGVDPFAAVGCGDQIAMGSLFSTSGKPAVERIQLALHAAERFSAGVRGPFHITRAS